jgi:thioredoxin 1
MLNTNLEHLETDEETQKTLKENENVMICCGRMGPMCIPVYRAMEHLQKEYPHVVFRDMEFDSKPALFIRNLPECRHFMGLPFTVYFKNGGVATATSSIQNRNQIVQILDTYFGENSKDEEK